MGQGRAQGSQEWHRNPRIRPVTRVTSLCWDEPFPDPIPNPIPAPFPLSSLTPFPLPENYERLEADKKKQVQKKRKIVGPVIRYWSLTMPLLPEPGRDDPVDVEG